MVNPDDGEDWIVDESNQFVSRLIDPKPLNPTVDEKLAQLSTADANVLDALMKKYNIGDGEEFREKVYAAAVKP